MREKEAITRCAPAMIEDMTVATELEKTKHDYVSHVRAGGFSAIPDRPLQEESGGPLPVAPDRDRRAFRRPFKARGCDLRFFFTVTARSYPRHGRHSRSVREPSRVHIA